MSDATLYHGKASTCSKKVRISLYEKGVPFESKLLDLQKFEQHAPRYLELNPKGVVPTLVHDGKPVVESSIIIEYVDEAFEGPPLSPKNPLGRARMRLWLRFSDEVAYEAVYAPTWQFFRDMVKEGLGEAELDETLSRIPTRERRDRWERMAKGGYTEEQLAKAYGDMEECLDKIQAQTSKTPWLAGDEFSLADIAVLPFVDRIRNLRPGLLNRDNRAAIVAWLARAKRRPSFDRAINFTEDPKAAELPNI